MCEAAFATTGSSDALKAATGVTVSDAEYQSFVFACRNLYVLAEGLGWNAPCVPASVEWRIYAHSHLVAWSFSFFIFIFKLVHMHTHVHRPPDKHATVSVGTAALIEYLQSTEPAAEYTFVLGADAFVDLVSEKWKESARLLQLLQGRFIVLERPEENSDTNNEENARHLLQTQVRAVPGARLLRVDHLTAVSSSQVRECGDVHLLQTMVVPAVLDYMRQHGLYAAFENNNNIN